MVNKKLYSDKQDNLRRFTLLCKESVNQSLIRAERELQETLVQY